MVLSVSMHLFAINISSDKFSSPQGVIPHAARKPVCNRPGKISQIKMFNPKKTSHTTLTLNIKLRVICLNYFYNKIKVNVV